jgi:hypothetical protein
VRGRRIGSCVGILAVVVVSFVWSPPVGATGLSSKAVPMSGGPNCGKRAKVYEKIWSVKAHDRRVVFLRCGEFQPPSGAPSSRFGLKRPPGPTSGTNTPSGSLLSAGMAMS